MAVSRLLRAIAADRHAAPPPRMTSRMVGEEKRTGRSLASLHVAKIFRADKLRKCLSDRYEQGLGCAPSANCLKLDRHLFALWADHDPAEGFIARQQTIQRVEFGESFRGQRVPLVLAHKASEPLAQAPCLIGDLVELAGEGLYPNALQRIRRNELGLLEPVQRAVAVIDPVDRRVDWCRD